MPRKTLAAVVLTNGGATTAAAYALAHNWPAAFAAGAFSAILVRVALAISIAPQPVPARRNDPQPNGFAGRGAGRPI
jgi:hypothetical protein